MFHIDLTGSNKMLIVRQLIPLLSKVMDNDAEYELVKR